MAHIRTQAWRMAVSLTAILAAVPLFAQLPDIGGGSPFAQAGGNEKPVTASATAEIDSKSGTGVLKIRARIKKGWHIFSITQKPGGPLKTKLNLDKKADAEFSGDPKALTKPDSHPEPAFNNLIVEMH
jgi:hypothetical protein